MKVLLIGTGGVGEAIAVIAKRQDPKAEWMKTIVLADYNLDRAKEVSAKLGDATRFPAEKVNAKNGAEIAALVKKHDADLIMNARSRGPRVFLMLQ